MRAGRRSNVAKGWRFLRHNRRTMARRIALVEDDPIIRQNYVDALTRAGYEVAAFSDRGSATKTLAARLPELAIIDIGLGADIDGGFALCRELRAASERLPIIFLSARDSDFDIVSGLRLGADDYLTKDVSLPHLLARIAALFRRVDATSQPPTAGEVLNRGPLALDAQRMMASWDGHPVGLTVTEFWMVHSLARHPGHVKGRPADARRRDGGRRRHHHLAREAHPQEVPRDRREVR